MKDKNLKPVNVHLTVELWAFLKKKAVDREMTLNNIMFDIVKKYKKKCDKKLRNESL